MQESAGKAGEKSARRYAMNTTSSQHWTSDEDKLEAFVLHRLDKKEMSLLTLHGETCDECRKRIQEEREILSGINRFGRKEMKRRMKLRLRRDQRKQFEWIHIASLAAAVVIMVGGVFTVRWFMDVQVDKTKVQEIILSEHKVQEPGEHSLWIIGKVIELKDNFGYSKKSMENKQDRLVAARDRQISGPISEEHTKSTSQVLSKGEIQRGLSDQNISESLQDKPLEAGKMAAPAPVAKQIIIAKKDIKTQDTARHDQLLASETATSQEQQITLKTDKEKIEAKIGTSSQASNQAEPANANVKSSYHADGKIEQRDDVRTRQKSSPVPRKKRPAQNIIVRRGDMKDLPASLMTNDVSAIHTRLERTPQGILLTFYSNAIQDTTATDIETIAPDSIIVSFHSKQIVYCIPGGLAGGL
jgi:hypothetical protein